METVIVICLLIIIVLLLQDKVVIKRKTEQKPEGEKANPHLPDIMGRPRPPRNFSVPGATAESQIAEQDFDPDTLDIEYDENEMTGMQIPPEDLDEVFGSAPDLADEGEEWNRYGISGSYNGFATGVTFEELSSVGSLLQKDVLEPGQKQTAIDIVQRLQGTELFALLESSIADASQKIAKIFDSTLSPEKEVGSSTLRTTHLDNFDIREFV